MCFHIQHDDSFPDPSILDTLDAAQHDDLTSDVKELEERTIKSRLSAERQTELRYIFNGNIDMFRVGLSSGPRGKYAPIGN